MKKANLAAGALLIALPFQVHAQVIDLTPSADRILSDPNYLPFAGQVYGTTAYTHGWTSGSSLNVLGQQTSTFRVNTNTLDQFVALGITDDLTLDASMQYAPENYREINYANGNSTSLDSSGFSDPTFGATWRALDQKVAPVILDLFGSYTPDLIDAHTGTASEDGTIARGGQSGEIGAALGYETRSFGLRGAFSANFLGDSDSIDVANGDMLQTQSHTNYNLSLDSQTRLTDLFSLNAGIDHTFAASTTGVNLSNGIEHFSTPGDDTQIRLALNYAFVPQAFVVSATYAHAFYDNSQTDYPNPALDSETRNRSGDIVGVKLYYATP